MRYYDFEVHYLDKYENYDKYATQGIICAKSYGDAVIQLSKYYTDIATITVSEWAEDTPILEISKDLLDAIIKEDFCEPEKIEESGDGR